MKKELDEALCKDFPLLFANRRGSIKDTCMAWGFEVEDGWHDIIREAASKIEPLIVQWKLENPTEEYAPAASQIKEKFGTLRFYLTLGTDEMYAIADEAERKSSKICVKCGEPGELRGRGWLYTACTAHTKERDLDDN